MVPGKAAVSIPTKRSFHSNPKLSNILPFFTLTHPALVDSIRLRFRRLSVRRESRLPESSPETLNVQALRDEHGELSTSRYEARYIYPPLTSLRQNHLGK